MAQRPRTSQDCFAEAAEAAGRPLSREALEDYFLRAEGRIARYTREGMTPESAAARAGRDLADEAAVARAIEKRQARINVLAQEGLRARVVEGRELESVEAAIAGVQRKGAFRNAALSLDAMGGQRVKRTMNAFMHEMDQAGLSKAFSKADPAFERDVANELGRLDDPTWGRATGNAQAKRMAEIIHKHQDALRLAENDAGAFIGKLDQYLARQSHDRFKIKRAGYEAWRDATLPRLAERTFDDILPEEREGWLRQVYNRLASGIHMGSEQGDWIAGFSGPANLAKKLSAERKLFFKSPDDWLDYNKQFGNGSLNGTVMATLERGSRAVEAMQLAGTNPRAMFGGWIDDLTRRAVEAGEVDKAAKLGQQKDRLLRLYDNAMRAPRPIENEKLATWFANIRAFQRFKLGGAALSSIPDLASTMAMAEHNGVGALDSLAWHLGSLFPDGAERKAAMREAGIGFDHMAHSLQTRFGAEDGVAGALAKSVDVFTRLSAQPWWTQNMKDASTLMLLHNVAEKAALPHESLPRLMQTTLRRYGIEAAEWDALRQVVQKAPDGNRYVFAGDIADLPDVAVQRLGPDPNKARTELERKYSTYIFDQVQEGMSEETPQIRDLLNGGGPAGNLRNELWRTATQFKQFPASFVARTLMREWSRDGVNVSGLAKVIAGSTLFGYMAMAAKDAIRGKVPFNPASDEYDAGQYVKNVMRAAAQGGGLGIYGDFLLGEVSRTGGGPITNLLGPAFGMTEDLVKALYTGPRDAALEGKLTPGRVGADALQAVKANAPFINLFWTRAALDYGVLYSLQETLSPGYLARFEHNAQKKSGQEFLLSPSRDHIPLFGR